MYNVTQVQYINEEEYKRLYTEFNEMTDIFVSRTGKICNHCGVNFKPQMTIHGYYLCHFHKLIEGDYKKYAISKIVKEIAQKGHLRKYHHLQDDNILKVLLNDRW